MAEGTGAAGKALDLLGAVLEGKGPVRLSDAADDLGLSTATAYRLANRLHSRGFIAKTSRGCYVPGHRLLTETHQRTRHEALVTVAAPALERAAKLSRRVLHLGVLEESMVTYLLKVGASEAAAFTKAGMQLEAYCSGIGKVLLAYEEKAARDSYLAGGPFVALTERTRTDETAIARHLAGVRREGYARDDREVSPELYCLAVPVMTAPGEARAAISASTGWRPSVRRSDEETLNLLRETAAEISSRLGVELESSSD